MFGRVVTDFSRKILDTDFKLSKTSKYFKGIQSLFNLITLCELNKDYIVFKSKHNRYEVGYVHDIRFDYVNGRVFCPIYVYKYMPIQEADKSSFKRSDAFKRTDTLELAYNQSVEMFDIWNSKQGYLVEDLLIAHKNFIGVSFFKFSLKDVPIRSEVTYEHMSVLFRKYIRSAVFNGELFHFDYYSTKYSYLTSSEKRLLKKYDLMWYSDDEYSDALNYKDVRSFSYADLSPKFKDEDLALDKSFYIRRIDFESYLLWHLHNHVYWEGLDFPRFLTGSWFFMKYQERGISLIFKRRWLEAYK